LSGVETVTVRSLAASAGATTVINTSQWDGVTTVGVASSVAGNTVQFTGLATDVTLSLSGDNDADVGYAATSTGVSSSVSLTNAGKGPAATASSLSYNGTGVATAAINVDMNTQGYVTSVDVALAGTNLTRLEAGSNVDTVTITGSGDAYVISNDTLSTVDASAFTGNLELALLGRSDVVVKGGSGNDELKLGTGISNNDSFDGGAGTDTISVTMNGFSRDLNTTNVEVANITSDAASVGTLKASASDIATFNLLASGASDAVSISQIADGATVNLVDNNLGAVTIDYKAATTGTINVGTAGTAAVGVGALTITDVENVTLNSIGTANTVSGVTFDTDINSFTVLTSGKASLDLTNEADTNSVTLGAGMETLSVTTNGSASFTWSEAGTGVTLNGGSALTALTLSANGSEAADIVMTSASFTIQADSVITLDANDKADITVDSFTLGNGSSGNSSTTLNLANAASSNITIDDIAVSANGTTNIVYGDNAKTGFINMDTINVNKGDGSGVANLAIDFGGAMAASASIGAIDIGGAGTGAQVSLTGITLAAGGQIDMSTITGSATTSANADMEGVSVVAASTSSFTVGGITLSGGDFGGIDFTGQGNKSTGTFGAINASTIGSTTINLASGGAVTITGMTAAQRIGAMEINGEDNATVTVTNGMDASSIGAVVVSGAPTVNLGALSGTFGGVDASAMTKSGSFTIDMQDVSAAVEVTLGAATNSVVSGAGDDVITLAAGYSANDTIKFSTSGLGIDQITNFGSSDTLALFTGGSAWSFMNGSGGSTEAAGALQAHASAGAITMASNDQAIVLTSAVNSTAEMISSLKANVSLSTGIGSGAIGDLVVVWTDGSDTYVSLAQLSAGGSAAAVSTTSGNFSALSMDVAVSDTTIAVVTGVTPEYVAGNIDLY
jgi:hypothetical protein